MQYLEIYNNSKRRLKEALLSMWAPGNAINRAYFEKVLEEEGLLAEPVFQTNFPWEISDKSFIQHIPLLDKGFVAALDKAKNFNFPKDRLPYKHQSESWQKLLQEKKSIVVTTGTGSGKTECFMIPVLQDLLRERQNGYQEGVQAIFLYPLNALMGSQQKRLSAWCNAVSPKITFAIYNGNTAEDVNNDIASKKFPELVDRDSIRKTPPQILFTNPTMLEYMLVRKKDQSILQKSQGKLRWIILDETHTYSGSAAAELAMQIRRIIDAFGVDIANIRFAATSATISSDNEESLKQFIADLTGKPFNEIAVINGKRKVDSINNDAQLDFIINQLNKIVPEAKINKNQLVKLRDDLNKSNVKSATEIGNIFLPNATIEKSLKIIDLLGDKIANLIETGREDAILPTRAHFFVRSIGGLFACTNPDCTHHKGYRIGIGSLTSYVQNKCSCGSPLIEIVSCNSCNNLLLELEIDSSYFPKRFRMPSKISEELFATVDSVSEDDNEDEEDNTPTQSENWEKTYIARDVIAQPSNTSNIFTFALDNETTSIKDGVDYAECTHIDGHSLCPHCGNRTDKFIHFRTSAIFLSRVLSSTLLEQASPMATQITASLWEGRKYIAFTDNRQGTAKSALAQNIDTERNWIRSSVYHYLASKRRENVTKARQWTEKEQSDYNQLSNLRQIADIDDLCKKLEQIRIGYIPNPSVSIIDIKKAIEDKHDLGILSNHFECYNEKSLYVESILLDQFGRRPGRGNSPETMGFIKLVYPGLKNCLSPTIARDNDINISDADWQDFLKICLDYFIRYNNHVNFSERVQHLLTQVYFPSYIYGSDCTLEERNIKKWPQLKLGNNRKPKEKQNRLILLLLAGIGKINVEDLDDVMIDKINSLLRTAWNQLSSHILTKLVENKGKNNEGYKLDLFEKDRVSLELITDAWMCPVNGVVMDTIFKGISPMIKGVLNKNTISRYKATIKLNYPYFPFADGNKRTDDNINTPITTQEIITWIDENLNQQRNLGLWSNLHERILRKYPLYLAAEHSAQQNAKTLEEIEKGFNSGKINILSCSTTMEMGVDIDEVSEVVMNNVPPKPSNYLQRAGRGGRRSESKVLALTFCSPNPIGTNVMKNPKWAMTHKTASPVVNLNSARVIQRHINSFFFACYVYGIQGIDIKSNVGDFFFTTEGNNGFNYPEFCNFLNNLLITSDLNNRYKEIVSQSCMGDVSISNSILACLQTLENVYEVISKRIILLEKKKSDLVTNEKYTESSPEIRAIDFQIKRLKEQNLIGFFAENDFIPSAGIPIGVVDFIKNLRKPNKEEKKENNFFKSNPSLHITRALAEYAPGNQIVLNEKCYKSEGILMKSEWSEANRAVLQSCPSCNYSNLGNTIIEKCPYCNTEMKGIQKVGSTFTELIEPAGFSVDYQSEPNRRIDGINQNFIEPMLLNMEPWENDSVSKIEIRTSTNESEILYFNKGKGFGYAICNHCGRAEWENASADGTITAMDNHKRLNGGRDENGNTVCSGNDNHGTAIKRNVLLGGRLQTDFVEIRFRDENDKLVNDENTIWTLGVILTRKLIEYLGVDNQEISFNVKKYKNYSTIFIFDTARGGAGYSTQFLQYFSIILDEALKEMVGCTCEGACTHCLIDRESQWYLDKLDRHKAESWLLTEYGSRSIVPVVLKNQFPNLTITRISTGIKPELIRVISQQNVKRITFFISNIIKDWNIQSWVILDIANRLTLSGKEVVMVMNEPKIKNWTAAELYAAIEAKGKYNIKLIENYSFEKQKTLCHIEYSNSDSYFYMSENANINLNEKWGETTLPIYRIQNADKPKLHNWSIDLNELKNDSNKILFEFQIKDSNIKICDLFSLISSKYENSKWNQIFQIMKNSSVTVSYKDIYIKNPLGCLMLVYFIKSLKESLNLKINALEFGLSSFFTKDYRGSILESDFENNIERNKFLENQANKLIQINNTKINDQSYLPHWRELVVESEQFILILRPNGGILNGWKLDNRNMIISNTLSDFDGNIKLFNQTKMEGILYNVVFEKK